MLVKPKGRRNCQTKKGKNMRERKSPTGRFLVHSAQTDAKLSLVCAGLLAGAASSSSSPFLPPALLYRALLCRLSASIPFQDTMHHQKHAPRCTACASSRVDNRCLGSSLPRWSHRTSPMPDRVPEMSSPCHICCHFIVSNLHFLFFVFCAQSVTAILPPPSG